MLPLEGGVNQGQPLTGRALGFRAILSGSLGHRSTPCLGLEPGQCFRTCSACYFIILFIHESNKQYWKRKSRGRPPTGATPVLVRVPPEILEAVDRWIMKQPEPQSRPQGILGLVELGLKAKLK